MDRKGHQALIAVLCLLTSCARDKPTLSGNTASSGAAGDVYVVCEGNYQSFNASLYKHNIFTDSTFGDLYASANSAILGDVFQSMARIGNYFFLVVNNSNVIRVVGSADYKLVANIPVTQPRYLLPVTSSKAYVSSIYSNKLYVLNTAAFSVADSILLPDRNTEGMCLYGNDAVVCTWDTAGNHIYYIDATSDKLVQSQQIAGYAPQAALTDREQMLWVLAGNQPDGKQATLTRLDPSTGQVLASYFFPMAADALNPVFNNTNDTLYFIEANYYGGTANNGIYRMGIHDGALPASPFVPAAPYQYFYALGISPRDGSIYIGDPRGFVQKGAVYVYRPDGTKTDSFSVGLGPGSFYFN